MEKPILNYDTLIRLTKAVQKNRDPEDIALITTEGVTHSLRIKGCAMFLFSPMSEELHLAGSFGLSQEYLDKGPINSMRSIASSLKDKQPVAIYDVSDDPRIQYPGEATKEGIASMLSVPMFIGDRVIGCMRVYTSEPWEFTLDDLNFVQAAALIVSMALEMSRITQGYRDSIEILKTMRDPRIFRPKRHKMHGHLPGTTPQGSPPPAM